MELIGRDKDVGSIRDFFEAAGVRGGALLVVGDAGLGKTAVLDEFAAMEAKNGTRVLRAAGVQFESDVNYSPPQPAFVLPRRRRGFALRRAPRRVALRTRLRHRPAPDRLVVSNAAALWLRSVAAD